jgi:AcrR family transcriptional regulator
VEISPRRTPRPVTLLFSAAGLHSVPLQSIFLPSSDPFKAALKSFLKKLLASPAFSVSYINMKLRAAPRRYTQTVRALSVQATGKQILDAFLARLMTQWFDEITLDSIAEDAGVTVQTILRRFGGKEGLLENAVKILAVQIRARRGTATADFESLVQGLIEDYEASGDAVIRLLALEPRHPALKEVLDFGRGQHRQWTSTAFAEVLSKLDTPARNATVDALVVVMDVYTWKLLRRDMGRSVAATATIMKDLIHATIAEVSESKQTKSKTLTK